MINRIIPNYGKTDGEPHSNDWNVYVLVNPRPGGKKLSKGKIAGQVGHACMRLGYVMGCTDHFREQYLEYVENFERKIVYNVYELPEFGEYKLTDNVVKYIYDGQLFYISAVKDHRLNTFIAMAIMTRGNIDKIGTGFKLL